VSRWQCVNIEMGRLRFSNLLVYKKSVSVIRFDVKGCIILFSTCEPNSLIPVSFSFQTERIFSWVRFLAVIGFRTFSNAHGIPERSAQNQQHRNFSDCSRSFITHFAVLSVNHFASMKSQGMFVFHIRTERRN